MAKLKSKKKKEEPTNEQKSDDGPVQEADASALTAGKTEKKKKKEKKHEEKFEVKIEMHGENPDKASPVVGYFPSGYDPLRNEGEDSQANVKFYRHRKMPGRMQLVVSPNESQVNFVGTSHYGEATAPQMCTYRLGVFDKFTQTLKIVPITANRVKNCSFPIKSLLGFD